MSAKAKAFIALVCGLGAAAAVWAVASWENGNTLKWLFYLAFAAISSKLKVRLPGILGNLSVNYVFILLAVIDLAPQQVIAVGMTAAVAQCIFGNRRLKPVQIAFSVAGVNVSVAIAYFVFRGPYFRALDDSVPMLLFWTTSIYFVVNTMLVSAVVGLTEGKPILTGWYQNFFWTGPQYLFGAGLTGLIHVCNQTFGWQYATLFLPGIYLLYSSYHLYLGRLEEEKRHVSEVAELHLRTIEALALAIEAKDDTTHTHLRRVQVYALEIARELGLSNDEIHALEAAALLHDIGKLAVPDYIINKPGRLTKEEFEKMKVHPVVGAEILECVQFPYPVVPIVRSHHEKWDGSGYPDGIKGESIPIGARILSAVDCLDALASDRQYRRALPLDQALAHVVNESGKSFDPQVVSILKRRHKELEEKARAAGQAGLNKLSTRARIQRGDAPAAGLAPSDDTKLIGPASVPMDFITSIAAARQEFQMLHEMSRDLGSSLSMEDTFSLLGTRLRSLVPYDSMAIYRLTEGHLAALYSSGDDSEVFGRLRIPLGEGLSGWVAQNSRPIVNGNPSVESGYLGDAHRFTVMRSAISVPLEANDQVIGALTLYRRDPDAFSNDHLRILLAVNSKAAMTIENAFRYQHVEKNAESDALTGLANASSLFVHLERVLKDCRTREAKLGVIVMDLDGFKAVNDRFGHLEGNRLLKAVADGLRKHTRETDFVARMGGDEFVVVLPGAGHDVLRNRVHSLEHMVEEIGREITGDDTLSLSAGAAMFPDDGNDSQSLLDRADQRMYATKRKHHAARGLAFATR
ncbi:MAG: diguanylate cyclase [Bryobacteraceae bacterium]